MERAWRRPRLCGRAARTWHLLRPAPQCPAPPTPMPLAAQRWLPSPAAARGTAPPRAPCPAQVVSAGSPCWGHEAQHEARPVRRNRLASPARGTCQPLKHAQGRGAYACFGCLYLHHAHHVLLAFPRCHYVSQFTPKGANRPCLIWPGSAQSCGCAPSSLCPAICLCPRALVRHTARVQGVAEHLGPGFRVSAGR